MSRKGGPLPRMAPSIPKIMLPSDLASAMIKQMDKVHFQGVHFKSLILKQPIIGLIRVSVSH
jgi:hypothetical protein